MLKEAPGEDRRNFTWKRISTHSTGHGSQWFSPHQGVKGEGVVQHKKRLGSSEATRPHSVATARRVCTSSPPSHPSHVNRSREMHKASSFQLDFAARRGNVPVLLRGLPKFPVQVPRQLYPDIPVLVEISRSSPADEDPVIDQHPKTLFLK